MQSAENLIRQFEDCKLLAYWDPLGHCWTIGWGHTGKDVFPDLSWSQEEADSVLAHDMMQTRTLVRMYSPTLAGTPFEAIVDFTYNLGIGRYRSSTLKRLIDVRAWQEAKIEIMKWDHSGGQVIEGLRRRRAAESELLV